MPARPNTRPVAIAAAVLLVGALVVVWALRRDSGGSGAGGEGRPVANAEAVIAEADAAFRQLVADDGAHPPPGAGCWFAPPAGGLRVACGPVRLGVTAGDGLWVIGPVNATGDPEPTGRFAGLDRTEALTGDGLARPDGADPPAATGLAEPDPVLRDAGGRHLSGPDALLAAADGALPSAAQRSRAAIAGDAACWFGATGDPARNTSDGALWCGPVLLLTSAPGETWTRLPLSLQQGGPFASVEARVAELSTIAGTQRLPAGTHLHRPDGRRPPEGAELVRPTAEARGAGFTEVVTDVPADLALGPPVADARLVVPGRSFEIDGVARVAQVGTGRTAVVAAAGEELLAARFRRTERGGADRGTAQIVVGTRRTTFTGWANLPGRGLLLVSVPRSGQAALEVVFDGVAQTISLATGSRGADSRTALYRPTDQVGVGRPADLSAPLPAGSPAAVTGTVTAVRLEAWRERLGWAPAGKAFVTVVLDGWKVDRPCCAVGRLEVTPGWTLALPDGTVLTPRPQPAGAGDGAVVFEAPETVTAAEVRLGLDATFDQRGTPGSVTAGPLAFPVEFPP